MNLLNINDVQPVYFGFIKIYALMITLGFSASIIASFIKLARNNIETDTLTWAIIFIVPGALFGSSVLGKIGQNYSFWSLWAFWKPGLAVHGGVLFGVLIGFIIFLRASRKNHISLWMYAECIIPNILLGQVIGRWGNFFNHELLGQIVGSGDPSTIGAINWLPAFIYENCYKLIGTLKETNAFGQVVYRVPIFLYESIGNLFLWSVITFIVPNLGKWIGPKPWKLHPNIYHFQIKNIHLVRWITFRRFNHTQHLTWRQIWNQAFYYQQLTTSQKQEVDQVALSLKESGHNWFQVANTRSRLLVKMNNHDGYWIPFIGIQTGCYFFGWNLLRLVLEMSRDSSDLFIPYERALDYGTLLALAILGMVIVLISQLVSPYLFRKNDWVYEKRY